MNGRVVVLEPGSSTLRLGLATQPEPFSVRHAIARRRRAAPGPRWRRVDPLLPAFPQPSRHTTTVLDQTRAQLQLSLLAATDSCSCFSPTVARAVASSNRRAQPVRCCASGAALRGPSGAATDRVVVGDATLLVDTDRQYNVHCPIDGSRLRVSASLLGGSPAAVAADLRDIWRGAIERHLGIDASELGDCGALLLVPCGFSGGDTWLMVDVLMTELRFGAVLVFAADVAAAFGAGHTSACVVSVGSHCSTVSRVQRGVSSAAARQLLRCGGGHVTQLLQWLLRRDGGWPYEQCCVDGSAEDAVLLDRLKCELCHLDTGRCAVQQSEFVVTRAHRAGRRFYLQVYDAAIVAPLALFTPRLMRLFGAGDSDSGGVSLADAVWRCVTSPAGDSDGGAGVRGGGVPTVMPVVLAGGGARLPHLASFLQEEIGRQGARVHQGEGRAPPVAPQLLVERHRDPALVAWRGACLLARLSSARQLWITCDEWRRRGASALLDKSVVL